MKAAIAETDRDEGTQFVPSEEWIDAFEQQSNAKGFEERLKRFARMRANMVARAGYLSDGVIRCAVDDEGPYASCDLGAHILLSEVAQRTSKNYKTLEGGSALKDSAVFASSS